VGYIKMIFVKATVVPFLVPVAVYSSTGSLVQEGDWKLLE
jgi:hypothetical protein